MLADPITPPIASNHLIQNTIHQRENERGIEISFPKASIQEAGSLHEVSLEDNQVTVDLE